MMMMMMIVHSSCWGRIPSGYLPISLVRTEVVPERNIAKARRVPVAQIIAKAISIINDEIGGGKLGGWCTMEQSRTWAFMHCPWYIYIYSNNNYGKYEFVIFLIIPRPLLIRKMAMWGNDVIRSRSRTWAFMHLSMLPSIKVISVVGPLPHMGALPHFTLLRALL